MNKTDYLKGKKHCKRCKHFKELGHVAHFCHAKELIMAESKAHLCRNYMVLEEYETGSEVFIASEY